MINASEWLRTFFHNRSAEYKSSQTLSGHMYMFEGHKSARTEKCLQAECVKVNVTPLKKVAFE